MATTEYMFQVRGMFEDVEGPYSPVSDKIKTKESLATQILGFCELLKNGNPSKYLLPAEENMKARNENAMTKQLIFGIIRRFLRTETSSPIRTHDVYVVDSLFHRNFLRSLKQHVPCQMSENERKCKCDGSRRIYGLQKDSII